jgi:dTDP-glucose 4,6-dehydratase
MPRAVVTGGAGFLGSFVCERLLAEGWEVLCLDTLLTGREENLRDVASDPRFAFERTDVTQHIRVEGRVDGVLHLASPASPNDYLARPIHTMKVGAIGTMNALGLAKATGARFLLASTSEAYGDPLVNPQPETYWGNVNPVGPRGVYDEAKRFAEAMTMAYHRAHGVRVGIARIFNTYGPRMRRDDGRAVPSFVAQALAGKRLTVHGDGSQTRSLCYVDDLVEGLWRLFVSNRTGPMNLGNPEEVPVLELAVRVREVVGVDVDVEFVQRPVDDPQVRRPDISAARLELGWEPKVPLRIGLERMVAWARRAWTA